MSFQINGGEFKGIGVLGGGQPEAGYYAVTVTAVEAKAGKLQLWGWVVVTLALAFCVGAAFMDGGGYIGRWPVLVAVVLIAIAIFLLAGAVTIRGNARNAPMLRRPARVIETPHNTRR